MRAYADSSFILRLVAIDRDSEAAMSEYRRLGYPPLFFLPLHSLEVRNSILHRAFHQRRTLPARERRQITRDRDAAFGRLERFIAIRKLNDVTLDMDAAISNAVKLSLSHTERLGARAIDVLHVAAALVLESELFLTMDECQEKLAKAEGLKVGSING